MFFLRIQVSLSNSHICFDLSFLAIMEFLRDIHLLINCINCRFNRICLHLKCYGSRNTCFIWIVIHSINSCLLGMIIGGDYIFSMWNFIGLNISAVATLMYIIITFGEKGKNSPAKTSPKVIPSDEKNMPKKMVMIQWS